MSDDELMRTLRQVTYIMRRRPPMPEGKPDMPPPPDLPPEGEPPQGGGFPMHERGRVLVLLEHENGINQKRLAELLGIRPQSLSEILGKLESDEMIERQLNLNDKRETLVFLSQHGKEKLESIKENRRRFATEFFCPLTEEEKETLYYLLNKLISPERK